MRFYAVSWELECARQIFMVQKPGQEKEISKKTQ